MTVDEIKSILSLQPHPQEGGFFRETYRAAGRVRIADGSPRALATAIYFLLTAGTFSELHRLKSDEVWHFYAGGPVEMLQLWPDGGGKLLVLGMDLVGGQRPQMIVPRGVWQGARLRAGGKFALLGMTVSPGFDYADYESGREDELVAAYPQFKELITALTRR